MRFTILALSAICLFSSPSAFAQSQQPAGQAPQISGSTVEQQLNSLTPEQRANLTNEAKQKWQTMTPEEKSSLENQAIGQFNSLTPADQEKLKAEALKQWQSMTPAQQEELKNSFSDLLKGSMQKGAGGGS